MHELAFSSHMSKPWDCSRLFDSKLDSRKTTANVLEIIQTALEFSRLEYLSFNMLRA